MTRAKAPNRAHLHIETLAALLLLVVLASLTVLLTFTTGGVYRRITAAGARSQELRTGLCFVATKVRQSESACVRRSSFGNALVLTQTSDGQTYEDWVFFYKGTLREGMVAAGTPVNPTACAVIGTLRSFTFAQTGKQLRVTASADPMLEGGQPETQSLVLALRT